MVQRKKHTRFQAGTEAVYTPTQATIASLEANHLASTCALVAMSLIGEFENSMQSLHSVSSTTARGALREHTRAAHERLHELESFRALLAGTLAHSAYARLLARMHGYYARVDAVLNQACARFNAGEHEYLYAARAPLFARDLAALGGTRIDDDASTVLPELASAAALAGALYVIEGSLLGGASLNRAARRLLAQEDSNETDGRCYWAWCHDVGAARWQHTSTLIDGWVNTPARLTQASAAAHATFERLHQWLEPQAESPC